MGETIFDCRSTSKGAFTAVTWIAPGVSVKKFSVSGSGNHWKEKVTGPVGAKFALTDITNSGKHQCTLFEITSDGCKMVEPEFSGCPCKL